MTAPIALFAYKRANEFQRTVQALRANYLAADSELHVFVDGPKRPSDVPLVEEVRALAHTITGFRAVHLHISEINKGCAPSIISGVSQLLQEHPSVVVVEDDIVTSPNFLDFINQGLVTYAEHPKVFSIGGYTFPLQKPVGYPDDVYFYGRTCAWGWGIWADRWFKTDWQVSDFDQFMADPAQRRAFNYYGSDRVRMLRRTMAGEVDTWDIRLCYEQFKQKQLTVYPTLSKVSNIGFDSGMGSNTNVFNRYKTPLDTTEQRTFTMPIEAAENEHYTQQLQHQFSLPIRLYNRLKTMAGMR